jgi:hypothetical protein
MGRKKGRKIEAKAIARVEAVAKATYQRKKTTTEIIPPDVSRAKAGAWLALLSPITEWASLKGDELNFKRRLLRIQQEETLLRVAQSVSEKLADLKVLKPVPRKILVPALEKASLEDAEDRTMIELWANLLASATQTVHVQPRFVGILEELAGTQAKCLERIAFGNSSEADFPAAEFEDSFMEFADYNIRELFESTIGLVLNGGRDASVALELIVDTFSRPGVLLGFANIVDLDTNVWETYDVVSETGIRDEEDLSILESLGLVRYAVITFMVHVVHAPKKTFEVSTHYHHLTRLGVEFCKICSKSRFDELEKEDNSARQKNLTRKRPFQLA